MKNKISFLKFLKKEFVFCISNLSAFDFFVLFLALILIISIKVSITNNKYAKSEIKSQANDYIINKAYNTKVGRKFGKTLGIADNYHGYVGYFNNIKYAIRHYNDDFPKENFLEVVLINTSTTKETFIGNVVLEVYGKVNNIRQKIDEGSAKADVLLNPHEGTVMRVDMKNLSDKDFWWYHHNLEDVNLSIN